MNKTIKKSQLKAMINEAVETIVNKVTLYEAKRDLGNGGFSEESLLNQPLERIEQGLINLGFEVEEYGDDINGNGVVYFSHPDGYNLEITYPWIKNPDRRDSYRAGKVKDAHRF